MKEKAKKFRKVETDEDGLEIGPCVIVIESSYFIFLTLHLHFFSSTVSNH